MSHSPEQLSETLRAQGKMITFAESCTGGLCAAHITSLPGSSDIFDRGFVTYSNDSKMDMINVSRETLSHDGAVSRKCATEMAQGALTNSNADLAISLTGIAGPGGGSPEKPVGLVYIGYASKDGQSGATENHFEGSRDAIREAAMHKAYAIALTLLEGGTP